MKILLLLQLFVSLVLAKSYGDHGQNSKVDHSEISEAEIDFALKLYKRVSPLTEKPLPNVFISPVSIYTTLSMLALGAQSETRKDILQGMGLDDTKTDKELHDSYSKFLEAISQDSKDVEFQLYNDIFIEESAHMLPSYKRSVTKYYNASIHTISNNDPQNAEKTINRIVSDKTDHKIQNITGNLKNKPSMFVVDYAVFQGKWKGQFDKQNTEQRELVSGLPQTLTPTMRRRGLYKTYKDSELDVNVLEMPYADDTALLLIIPRLGNLFSMEQLLTPQLIQKYLSSLSTSLVELFLPKMTFNTPVNNVDKALLNMGFGNMFDENSADFSGISKKEKFRVSSVLHRSYINFEEGGTMDSAATSAALNLLSPPVPPAVPQFNANRPFIMMLYHKDTKTILGIGRFVDPK